MITLPARMPPPKAERLLRTGHWAEDFEHVISVSTVTSRKKETSVTSMWQVWEPSLNKVKKTEVTQRER